MARTKAHPVGLSAQQRELLRQVVRTGASPAQQVRRARILLELDENHADQLGALAPTHVVVAERAGVSVSTVSNISRAYAERGGDVVAVITRKKRLSPPVAATVTGEVEARLIAMACSPAPAGFSRWSLRLLERHVALTEDLPDVDHSTIGRVLSKRRSALT